MLSDVQQFVLLRLNYEWRHLIDIIRNLDDSPADASFSDNSLSEGDSTVWKSIYQIIVEKLGKCLKHKVNISSEYMIFDNCIRQLDGDVYLLEVYHTLVDSFKQILNLSVFLPMEKVHKHIYVSDECDWFASKFEEINKLIFKRDLTFKSKKYDSYELTVDGLLMLEDLMADYPNETILFQEVVQYIESMYMHKIWLPRLPISSGDDRCDCPDCNPPRNLTHCILL